MTTYRTVDGDMVDQICQVHYGSTAHTAAVYEANPRLAALGPVLAKGHVLTLPEVAPAPIDEPIRLWSKP